MKTLLTATALLLAGTSARAQVRFSIGPQVGGMASTLHASSYPTDSKDNYLFRAGFAAGVLASLNVGHFAVQPALLYAQKGLRYRSEADVQSSQNGPLTHVTLLDNTRYDYLTLPLNLGYTQQANGQGFQVFAGPYLSALLGGNLHATSSAPTYSTAEDVPLHVSDQVEITTGNGPYARRFEGGLQGGLGYRHQALLVQASYSLGLRSVRPNYTFGGQAFAYPSIYNRVFQLSLAYLFGPQH